MNDHHHGPAKGLKRWLFATNHKDIGTMYLWFSFSMFILGGIFAMIVRAELFQPGLQLVEPEFFNQMTTMHGLIMVFGAIMPSFVGLANWMIPLMIGAPDMALPRMNNWSFWILPPTFLLLASPDRSHSGNPSGFPAISAFVADEGIRLGDTRKIEALDPANRRATPSSDWQTLTAQTPGIQR